MVNADVTFFQSCSNAKFHNFFIGVRVFYGNSAHSDYCVYVYVKFYFYVLNISGDCQYSPAVVDIGQLVYSVYNKGFFQQGSCVRGVSGVVVGAAKHP